MRELRATSAIVAVREVEQGWADAKLAEKVHGVVAADVQRDASGPAAPDLLICTWARRRLLRGRL